MKKLTKNLISLAKRFRWLLIIALILATIISVSIYNQTHKKVQYITDKVTLATVIDSTSESGNIQAENQANINSPIDGIVGEINVTNGNYVTEGQALFSIKSTATDAEIATVYGQYLQAQNGVQLAQQNQNALIPQIRTAKKQLVDATALYIKITKSIATDPATTYTATDLASARLAYSAAKVNVINLNTNYDKADATINAAKQAEEAARLSYEAKNIFVVKAPTAGFVSNLAITVGDKVSASGFQTTAATPSLIVANTKNLFFKSQFNEIDIPKIKIGQAGQMTIDAIKNQTFTGQVEKIDTIGANAQGVISYNVYLSVNNPDPAINIGMSGNVTIETQKHENILTVANSAIKPYQGGKAVQMIADAKKKTLKYVPVQVGLKGIDRTEVTSGVKENDIVVITISNTKANSLFGGK